MEGESVSARNREEKVQRTYSGGGHGRSDPGYGREDGVGREGSLEGCGKKLKNDDSEYVAAL